MLIKAKKYLRILELTNFAWTINDIKEQPEEDLEAVFGLKGIGAKIAVQAQNAKREAANG